ncbi:pyridoxal phosphate-dependent decarboxylase family protein [Achromobacter xylosoxidans]|uniref:pyridoxal phosphate-dependent decarboxylase family protein n=1 Tax=Alcaligenes xylosoxydans xylosoxydans TaxID=85698 RepID=UPI000B48A252|nr:aspartate aminotransferase family protein [Achromobacter xylosoxidans]
MTTPHSPLSPRIEFPATGTPWPALEKRLDDAKNGDYRWDEGRMALYVYWLDDALGAVSKNASAKYFMENGLGRKAFPSVQRLESEVIDMALSLFNAPAGAAGSFTSGGTESIFQAVKSARSLKRATGDSAGHERLKIVVPRSAHPAFNKAAYYLDMDVQRIAIGDDFRADVQALNAAVDDRTALIVGSAPAYPHGVYDPIAALSEVALKHQVPLHVDACVGGFLGPFMKLNGEPIPDFDFSLPGVTSISADIHKYGFAAKGASLILYRNEIFKQHQRFEFDDWPRGHYETDTFLGTRPASPVASAWAVLNYLGTEGYRGIAKIVADTRNRMIQGIEDIEGLEVLRPHSELSFVLYRSRDPSVDINAVAQELDKKGWFVGVGVDPVAIHFMVNPVHQSIMERYLDDLRAAVKNVRDNKLTAQTNAHTY